MYLIGVSEMANNGPEFSMIDPENIIQPDDLQRILKHLKRDIGSLKVRYMFMTVSFKKSRFTVKKPRIFLCRLINKV